MTTPANNPLHVNRKNLGAQGYVDLGGSRATYWSSSYVTTELHLALSMFWAKRDDQEQNGNQELQFTNS